MKKYIVYFIVACVLSLLGFYAGYKSVKLPEPIIKTEVKYVKGETVHDSITIVKPVIIKPDTLDILAFCIESGLVPKDTVTVHDTVTLMIQDWASKKHYQQTLWDNDTTGTCTINMDLQYNTLQNLTYTYTPIITNTLTTEIIKKERIFQPIIGAGLTTNNNYLLSLGALYRERFGIMALYQHPFTGNKDYTLGIQALVMF